MSSDWKDFFCAMMNWNQNQKHCLVGYEIVQSGTDLLTFQRDMLPQFPIL
jgi:hypothetical protein